MCVFVYCNTPSNFYLALSNLHAAEPMGLFCHKGPVFLSSPFFQREVFLSGVLWFQGLTQFIGNSRRKRENVVRPNEKDNMFMSTLGNIRKAVARKMCFH